MNTLNPSQESFTTQFKLKPIKYRLLIKTNQIEHKTTLNNYTIIIN